MKWQPLMAMPLAAVVCSAYAAEYMTVEQAQAAMFPGEAMTQVPLKLESAQRSLIEERSGVSEAFDEKRVWKTASGFFIVDEVVGKHEKIKYAVALDAKGVVKRIEILSYRESYGSEVRSAEWRSQFAGKTANDPVKLGADIRNISGATLSSKHITQGVKRVLALYDIVLSRI